jgi:hypothetical protein
LSFSCEDFNVIILLISLLLVQQSALPWDTPGRPPENGRWLCWSYNGDGSWVQVIPRAQDLQHYLQNSASFDAELQWSIDHDPGWTSISGRIETVGTLAGREVVDIFFTAGDQPKPFGKMVLIGHEGLFRPVIWILDQMGVDLSQSSIIQVDTREILVSRCRVSGTGNFYLEDYLVFNEKGQIPKNLRADDVIQETLKKVLPKGLGVWKGGGFAISTLTFVSPVWKKGDGTCCPTGGRIAIKLQLIDDCLTVADTDFDPSFDWK